MNFLPIIILLFLFMKKDSLQWVLSNINIDDIKETLKTFGIENDLLNGISSETISEVLSGNFKAILPLLPSILATFNKGGTFTSDGVNDCNVGEELSPIKDIASETITSTLGSYFK